MAAVCPPKGADRNVKRMVGVPQYMVVRGVINLVIIQKSLGFVIVHFAKDRAVIKIRVRRGIVIV